MSVLADTDTEIVHLDSEPNSVGATYQSLIGDGVLHPDHQQAKCVAALDGVRARLDAEKQTLSLFSKFASRGKRQEVIKGLYVWGAVGRGKTLLMDMFFEAVKEPRKQRVHFHEFMDEVHNRIAAFRKSGDADKVGDPIPYVVAPIIQDVKLLCFDEFHVNDITDAMLLKRLFEKLFEAGIVMVATSNVVPDQLYKNGLNRQLFLPFIDLLHEHADVLNLASDTDYRRQKLETQPVFFFGPENETRSDMDNAWRNISGGVEAAPKSVDLLGRDFVAKHHFMGAARFGFKELCEAPMGARDYLRLSHQFHTFVIDGVPRFDRARSDAAKRLILLIDTLYDRGVKLVASFEAPLDGLSLDDKTAFEFQRTISRLIEMQSKDYLAAPLKDAAE